MRFGVNVGVHTYCDWRGFAHAACDLGNDTHLRFAFNVELTNATFKCNKDFLARFAHTGKHDPLSWHASRLGARVLTARNHIHASAKLCQRFQDRLVRCRFHGVTHQMVRPIQCLIKQLEMPRQGSRGVEIERRANGRRDIGDTHILGVQFTVAIKKMIQDSPLNQTAPQ